MIRDFFAIKIRLVEAMQKANKPLILQHVAKLSKLTPQHTSYHVSQMIEWGIVLKVEHEDKTYFILQPAYYDRGWRESLFALMTPYIEAMISQTDFSQAKVSEAKASIRNLIIFLRLFEKKIVSLINEKSFDKKKERRSF